MGTPLTGSSVASTYTGLLKSSDNSALTSVLKAVGDGSGIDSALQLSTSAVNSTGDFSVGSNKLTVAAASGNTVVGGTFGVTGATNLSTLATSGATTIGGNLTVTGGVNFSGGISIPGSLTVSGISNMFGNVTMGAALSVIGNAGVGGTFGVTGNSTFQGTVGVTGATTLASVGVTGAATVGTTLDVTGAATLDSVDVTGAATVGTTLNVTGLTTASSLTVTGASNLTTLTVSGAVATNGNTTIGNDAGDTLTINSNAITVPNVSTVAIDPANDKLLIQDATDNNVRLVTASSVTPIKAIYSEKISNTQSFTFSSITSVYAYNANGGSQFQYTHTFKGIGNTAIINMSVPAKLATASQVYVIIADGSSLPSIANVIACGVASVGSANGETTISLSTKFVSTSLSHTFYIWVAGSGSSATLNTYTPAGGLPGYFYPNSIFSLIETA
jgi:hypothetical protein